MAEAAKKGLILEIIPTATILDCANRLSVAVGADSKIGPGTCLACATSRRGSFLFPQSQVMSRPISRHSEV